MAQRTSGGVYNRRTSALKRLEEQLKRGTIGRTNLPLSDKDKIRIEKEIQTLKSKL